MRLYELLSQSTQQQLDQIDQQNQKQVPGQADPSAQGEDDGEGKFDADKVDSSLKDVAQSVDDQNAQPDMPGGMPQNPPQLDDQNVKPIDAALLGQIKNLPYSSKYKFKGNSPIAPLKIAALSLSDLSNLRNMIRFKIQETSISDRVGLDDDGGMQFLNDILNFTNTVMKFKKTNTSAQLGGIRPAPAYQNMRPRA